MESYLNKKIYEDIKRLGVEENKMDKFQVAMGMLVEQYNEVYRERQSLMQKMRKHTHEKDTQEKEEYRMFSIPKEWYNRMRKDGIDASCSTQRESTYFVSSVGGPLFFKSKRAKQKQIKYQRETIKLNEENPFPSDPDPTEYKKILARVEATPVHPYAKQILAYSRMQVKLAGLSKKKTSLGEAIRQMNKLRLGIYINFGYPYAEDRIESVTIDKVKYSVPEFLKHVAFEATCLG